MLLPDSQHEPEEDGEVGPDSRGHTEDTQISPCTASIRPGPNKLTAPQLKELLPTYAWARNPGSNRHRLTLGPDPKALGYPKHKNPYDKKCTIMDIGIHLFAPMEWYLNQLGWGEQSDAHQGTTNAELAIDFEAATGIPLQRPDLVGPRTLRTQANTSATTARRVAHQCGNHSPIPGLQLKYCTALVPLKYRGLPGYALRARLLHPDAVAAALAQPHIHKLGGATTNACFDFTPK